ncbi:MAG: hypothetical protein LBU65_13690 [Planctomycetaceae bacterium]|jgi:uncharacterized membrane protein|nr:hypothetical protein [Planctomycetaceae bacterium]
MLESSSHLRQSLFYSITNKLEELKAKMGNKFMDLIRDEYEEAFAKGETKGKTEGEIRGKVRAKAESVLSALKIRFNDVPQNIVDAVSSYTDLTALDSLLQCAILCGSVKEFEDSLVHG